MKVNRLHIVLFSIIVFFATSCQSPNDDKIVLENKSDVLNEEIIVPLLKDVLVLEASLYFKANQGADMKTMTTVYYNQLFEKYNTDRKQFYSSVKYYVQNGDEDNNIFTDVVNMLTVESDSIRRENATTVIEGEKQKEKSDSTSRGGIFRRILKKQEEAGGVVNN